MTGLVYTDAQWVDQGYIENSVIDLAYGTDENDFSIVVPDGFHVEKDALVYVDGTGWGGIVRGSLVSTLEETPQVAVTGTTWHGLLAESFIVPSGASHVSVSGDAHDAMREILARQGLDRVFDVAAEPSGYGITYTFDRFADVYAGFRKMLAKVGAKLAVRKDPGSKPTLSAVEAVRRVDDSSSTGFAYEIAESLPYNHVIAVGTGEMEERIVVHRFADESGAVSDRQTIFFPRERQYLYELSSADAADLAERAEEKLAELQDVGTCELRLPEDMSFDVGDYVGVVDEITGASAAATVTKVIVRTGEDGELEVSNEIGDVTPVPRVNKERL